MGDYGVKGKEWIRDRNASNTFYWQRIFGSDKMIVWVLYNLQWQVNYLPVFKILLSLPWNYYEYYAYCYSIIIISGIKFDNKLKGLL